MFVIWNSTRGAYYSNMRNVFFALLRDRGYLLLGSDHDTLAEEVLSSQSMLAGCYHQQRRRSTPAESLVAKNCPEFPHTSWIALRSALGISILAVGPVSTQLGILVWRECRRWGVELPKFEVSVICGLHRRNSKLVVGLEISGAAQPHQKSWHPELASPHVARHPTLSFKVRSDATTP